MKRPFLALVSTLLGLLLMLPVGADSVFQDISGHAYERSIQYLYNRGVLQGYRDGSFRPDQGVNRAELLKMAFAAMSMEEGGGVNCFKDVAEEWFAPYVCHAKELEVVQGYEDGRFLPAQKVNMAEAFKILAEIYEMPIRAAIEGEAWYEPYADFMHLNGWMSKYSYYPWRDATRAKVAFWIHQFMLVESGDVDLVTVRDAGSEGCGLLSPFSAPTVYWVDGEQREAIVDIPEGYDPNRAYSLIVAFHGRTSPNTEVRSYYRLGKVAGKDAILVYPAGKSLGDSFNWADSGDPSNDLRDYEFFDQIVEQISASYCVNEDEIFAVGHSLGAWFVNSLACARGDVLRGVATLGGARAESVCTGPVAVMQWHNPNDRLAPFYTGQTARDYYLEQNFCSYEGSPTEPSWAHCVEYSCMEGAPTLWCPHTEDYSDYSGEYYPHNWPRETGEEMWAFFRNLE